MSNINSEENDTGGRYTFQTDSGPLAELTYSKTGETMIIIDHTEVPDDYRGQGVGEKLVERVVTDMRAAGKKIIPLCPFANAQFRRHPDWQDVLTGRRKGD